MYARTGRPSVPPERLLKALLLIALYSIRSERPFCEQLDYNLLRRWFLDMDMVEGGFDASTFSRNRDRLLKHDVAGAFFRQNRDQARGKRLMSSTPFAGCENGRPAPMPTARHHVAFSERAMGFALAERSEEARSRWPRTSPPIDWAGFGAGNGIRTHDLQLGKRIEGHGLSP